MPPRTLHDPSASLTLLTGDDWAPWIAHHVAGAERSILGSYYMISPFWRDPKNLKLNLDDVLAGAATRGLVCRMLLDQPNISYTTRPFNARAAKTLNAAGWKVRLVPDRRTLHEKVLVVDGRTVLIGSHNISKASMLSNYDASVAIDSEPFAAQVTRHFWELWRIGRPLKV